MEVGLRDAKEADKFSRNYTRWVSISGDGASSIEKRHSFYLQFMFKKLAKHLSMKDEGKDWANLEKEIVYLRNERACQVCKMLGRASPGDRRKDIVIFDLLPEQEDRVAKLDNAVLVHKECKPSNHHDREGLSEILDKQFPGEPLINWPPGADNRSSVDCEPVIQGVICNPGKLESQQGALIRPFFKWSCPDKIGHQIFCLEG